MYTYAYIYMYIYICFYVALRATRFYPISMCKCLLCYTNPGLIYSIAIADANPHSSFTSPPVFHCTGFEPKSLPSFSLSPTRTVRLLYCLPSTTPDANQNPNPG